MSKTKQFCETSSSFEVDNIIKGPDNPTCQLLPTMSNRCCSGTGKEGKTKDVVKDREVKTVVCDKVVCERWCVTKKDGMYVCMYACMHGCMYVWMDGWMDVWMYGCMDVWMYGCMYVCMYVCIERWNNESAGRKHAGLRFY